MGTVVTTGPSVEPVTLAEAKLHCRVDVSDDDALITRLISAARSRAEQITQRSIAEQSLTLYLDEFPTDAIELLKGPVNTITSVKYYDDAGVLTTITSTNYALDATQATAWVLPAYGYSWPSTQDVGNAVRVEYTAGWAPASVPADIKAWILAAVAAMYGQREAIAQSDRVPSSVRFIDGLLDRWTVAAL